MSNRVAYLGNEAITNEESIKLFYGELKIFEPIIFTHIIGKKWTDMLAQTHNNLPFFSERVITVLEENHFTGWAKYEIEIENKPSEISTKYFGIFIEGRCKNNVKTFSQDRQIRDWDGSDFFTMKGTSLILITERVYNCLSDRKLKLTNFEFKTLEEYLL